MGRGEEGWIDRLVRMSRVENPVPVRFQESPVTVDEMLAESEWSDGLSEDFLREVTGQEDLASVRFAELVVDSDEVAVHLLGERLPGVRELKLSNSMVPRARDLGTGLRNLRILWLSRSGLADLDGIGALDQLREVYLAFNDVVDISPLGQLDHLEIADLDSNNVADLDGCFALACVGTLKSLTLEGNPCADDEGEYRRKVVGSIPHLQMLDDVPVSDADRAGGADSAGEGKGGGGREGKGSSPAGRGGGESPSGSADGVVRPQQGSPTGSDASLGTEGTDDETAGGSGSGGGGPSRLRSRLARSISDAGGPSAAQLAGADLLREEKQLVRTAIKEARIGFDNSLGEGTSGFGFGAYGARPGSAQGLPPRTGQARPGTARTSHSWGARPSSGWGSRPGTANWGSRPGSAMGSRPGTSAISRPGTASRPGTSSGYVANSVVFGGAQANSGEEDAGSALTQGGDEMMSANPAQMLRRRKKAVEKDTEASEDGKAEDLARAGSINNDEVLVALKVWKLDTTHQTMREEYLTKDTFYDGGRGAGMGQVDTLVLGEDSEEDEDEDDEDEDREERYSGGVSLAARMPARPPLPPRG